MDENLIKSIIYSQFDQRIGPTAVVWLPQELSYEVRNLVSLKTIQVLGGEGGKVPESLAFIPFPSINLKGLVKFFEIEDLHSRGGSIDSSLTILFNESDDLVFYKYIKDFEAILNELAKKILQLEKKKSNKKKILGVISKFNQKMVDLLNKLRASEISIDESAEFPVETEEESTLSHQKYKLIVCGDPSVGKTSTILRFTDNAFRRTYIPTIGVNLSNKTIQYKDFKVSFVLWDIAGQSKFQKMRSTFYRGADGLILVFDLTSLESFHNIPKWYKDVKNHLKKELPGLILGNKNDLVAQRQVEKIQGKNLAEELNLDYFETSALTGDNIHESFFKMAELLEGRKKQSTSSIKKKKTISTKKSVKRRSRKSLEKNQ